AVDFELCLSERFHWGEVLLPEIAVKESHQSRRRFVRNLPERTHHVPRPGEVERSLQTEGALAARHVAHSRLAGAQDRQFQARQVQVDELLAGNDPATGRLRIVRTRENQPRHHEGTVDCAADAFTPSRFLVILLVEIKYSAEGWIGEESVGR